MRGKKEYDYQNEYNRQKYDRVGLMLPKGNKELWQAEANRRSMSLNTFIQTAVEEYVERHKEE